MHTIEVPYNNAGLCNGGVSCLVASKCGLMAVLEENYRKMFIYNHERRDVLEFPLIMNGPNLSFQMALDAYNNIIIAQSDHSTLPRFNMNGKALPHLEVPVNNPTGVACSPEGDIFVSSKYPNTIVKKAVGQSKWVTIYYNDEAGEDDDDDESYDEFDPTRFAPGQLSVGSGCELFVATDNCINVLNTNDGKLKRQIACDMYRDGELSRVEGICVTGDDYLFISSEDCVYVYTTDGEYLNKFGGDEERQGIFSQPWGITVDCKGYVLVSDVGNGKIQVF